MSLEGVGEQLLGALLARKIQQRAAPRFAGKAGERPCPMFGDDPVDVAARRADRTAQTLDDALRGQGEARPSAVRRGGAQEVDLAPHSSDAAAARLLCVDLSREVDL